MLFRKILKGAKVFSLQAPLLCFGVRHEQRNTRKAGWVPFLQLLSHILVRAVRPHFFSAEIEFWADEIHLL